MRFCIKTKQKAPILNIDVIFLLRLYKCKTNGGSTMHISSSKWSWCEAHAIDFPFLGEREVFRPPRHLLTVTCYDIIKEGKNKYIPKYASSVNKNHKPI